MKREKFQLDTTEKTKLSNFSNSLKYWNVTQGASDKTHITSSNNETCDIFQTVVQNAIVRFMSKLYSNSSVRNIVQIIIEENYLQA